MHTSLSSRRARFARTEAFMCVYLAQENEIRILPRAYVCSHPALSARALAEWHFARAECKEPATRREDVDKLQNRANRRWSFRARNSSRALLLRTSHCVIVVVVCRRRIAPRNRPERARIVNHSFSFALFIHHDVYEYYCNWREQQQVHTAVLLNVNRHLLNTLAWSKTNACRGCDIHDSRSHQSVYLSRHKVRICKYYNGICKWREFCECESAVQTSRWDATKRRGIRRRPAQIRETRDNTLRDDPRWPFACRR